MSSSAVANTCYKRMYGHLYLVGMNNAILIHCTEFYCNSVPKTKVLHLFDLKVHQIGLLILP
jgi:hypothetical protein